MIGCHIAEGTYNGTISWLKNPISIASAHFVVSKNGEVTQLVDLRDAAWAQGLSASKIPKSTLKTVRDRGVNPNLYCISIEHEGKYKDTKGALTDAQKVATVELIKHIRAEVRRIYNIDIPISREHIVGHNEINPNSKPHCPGEKFPFEEIISELKGETKVSFKVGDIVKIRESAQTYFTGENIPDWVKNKSYAIKQMSVGKVLLADIISWIRISDIVSTSDSAATQKPQAPEKETDYKSMYEAEKWEKEATQALADKNYAMLQAANTEILSYQKQVKELTKKINKAMEALK